MGGVANPLGIWLLVFASALDVVGYHNRTVAEVGHKELYDLQVHARAAIEQYDVHKATWISKGLAGVARTDLRLFGKPGGSEILTGRHGLVLD